MGGLCCACCTCGPPGSALDWWCCNASKYGGCDSFGAFVKTSTTVAQEGGPETLPAAKPLYIRIFEDMFPFNLIVKKLGTRVLFIIIFLGIAVPSVYGVTKLE